MEIDLPDLHSMEELGKRLAACVMPGDVIALSGGLGAGKTTLARAILLGMGHRGEVPSPTFTIMETYEDLDPPAVHADFYRLDDPSDAEQLGLDDYRQGAVLIAEWPELAGGFAGDPQCLSIDLQRTANSGAKNGEPGRKAIVEPGQAWLGRMA